MESFRQIGSSMTLWSTFIFKNLSIYLIYIYTVKNDRDFNGKRL